MDKDTSSKVEQGQSRASGVTYAILAYTMWGFLPPYMKAVSHISPVEVVAHRVIWSLPLALAVVFILGRWKDLYIVLHQPRAFLMAAVAAALVSANWLIYVWAISTDQTLEASLGYYMAPLFSVFLGWVFLSERLYLMQWLAIFLAGAAVVVLTIDAGRIPLAALGLMVSWSSYAYMKRSLPIGPNQGFVLEVIILLPFALVVATWFEMQGQGHFIKGSVGDILLLLGCGVVTAVPLMVYANGAKGVRLSTIAMLQYLVPTFVLLSAVFLFGEPVRHAHIIAFPMIWAAIVIFGFSLLRSRR